MRISDWSSDVCSSDLRGPRAECRAHAAFRRARAPERRVRANWSIPVAAIPTHAATRVHRASAIRYATGADRKSVVSGKRVSLRVVIGGGLIFKKKIHIHKKYIRL